MIDATQNAVGTLDPGEAVQHLNSFLRGEIAAVETYRMAIGKIDEDDPENAVANAGLLQGIQEEHQRAADSLRDRIKELGGEPSDASGAWGAWAASVQGTRNLFGDTSALKGLKEGEVHGLKDYQSALDEVDPSSKQLIANQLIPAQQRHLSVLDQLIGTVEKPC